ncbi:MAG: phosphoribosyl-AMP cyclohydrolase, partial [Myxococcales bacterium]|nr:phosphoribosyl-AMP cyclohydrolase [Myxococcales bacterium]
MTDRTLRTPHDLDALAWTKADGLLPVVAQEADTGAVLMVAWANREALEATLVSGRMHYWSRSRGELWRKGDTSGAVQSVVSLHADCDGDTVLALVRQTGAACHTGDATCFGAGARPGGIGDAFDADAVLATLDATLTARAAERPEGSYTVR